MESKEFEPVFGLPPAEQAVYDLSVNLAETEIDESITIIESLIEKYSRSN